MKKVFRKVQGALPVFGLLSRLTSPEGGIGTDETAYPEYCRMVYDAAPEGFQIAVAELQKKYGDCAQRRYVLLCMWMVREGCGLCDPKTVVGAARRVRISYVFSSTVLILPCSKHRVHLSSWIHT